MLYLSLSFVSFSFSFSFSAFLLRRRCMELVVCTFHGLELEMSSFLKCCVSVCVLFIELTTSVLIFRFWRDKLIMNCNFLRESHDDSWLLITVHLFSGRIVMGLFGKTVPKTAGMLAHIWFDSLMVHASLQLILLLYLLLITTCFFLFTENFRALCTGTARILAVHIFYCTSKLSLLSLSPLKYKMVDAIFWSCTRVKESFLRSWPLY